MRASLHSDIRVSGQQLIDARVGLRYTLTPDAAWLIGQLLREERLDPLTESIRLAKQIPEAQARAAIFLLLGRLGAHGAVLLRRERSDNRWLFWRFWSRWPGRYEPSWLGLARAVGRAYGLLFLPLEAVFLAAAVVPGVPLPTTFGVWPLLLMASFVLHELGHLLVARLLRVPVVLLARPGYMALLYKRPTLTRARAIAAAGPIAAVIGCASLAALSASPPTQLLALGIGLVHVVSFLPFFADGKTIWRHV